MESKSTTDTAPASKPTKPVKSWVAELKKKAKMEKNKQLEEEKENIKAGYVFEEELSLHKSHLK